MSQNQVEILSRFINPVPMKQKKAKENAEKGQAIRQVAALPYRRASDGSLEVMLVTSRGTQRFIIPKGWPMDGLEDWQAAEVEAREEAGVVGEADREPIGFYGYWKRMKSAFVPIRVDVYPLEVVGELPVWIEASERNRGWVAWQQARALIDEPELISLIDAFADRETDE